MKYYKQITCTLLMFASSGLIQSCSKCDTLTAAAMATGVVAIIPGVDDNTRVTAAIATPVLGYFAFNCYKASDEQKRQAEIRAKELQKKYQSQGGSAKNAQRYYAVPVSRNSGAPRKFAVKQGVKTKDVILVDAEKGTVTDSAVYEIDGTKKSVQSDGKTIAVAA